MKWRGPGKQTHRRHCRSGPTRRQRRAAGLRRTLRSCRRGGSLCREGGHGRKTGGGESLRRHPLSGSKGLSPLCRSTVNAAAAMQQHMRFGRGACSRAPIQRAARARVDRGRPLVAATARSSSSDSEDELPPPDELPKAPACVTSSGALVTGAAAAALSNEDRCGPGVLPGGCLQAPDHAGLGQRFIALVSGPFWGKSRHARESQSTGNRHPPSSAKHFHLGQKGRKA